MVGCRVGDLVEGMHVAHLVHLIRLINLRLVVHVVHLVDMVDLVDLLHVRTVQRAILHGVADSLGSGMMLLIPTS